MSRLTRKIIGAGPASSRDVKPMAYEMIRRHRNSYAQRVASYMLLLALGAWASSVNAAELSVADLNMLSGTTDAVVVSGAIAGESTFGVNLLVELVPRAGTIGTLAFTSAPPIDIVQLGDPWPAAGSFSPFDTDVTASSTLNGSVDDNGTFVVDPVSFSGQLVSFPVIASAGAEGVWDVFLSTSAGDSNWEGLPTTLFAGTVTVVVGECAVDGDCNDGIGCTDDRCLANSCVSTANDANCASDGLFCNGVEFCDFALDCVSNGDPCTIGTFCNEATDACDECQLDVDCDDGVNCTNDTCNAGSCAFVADNLNCVDDGLFCSGAEVCDALLGCLSTGDPCQISEFCNEATDACDQCQVDLDCDDGVPCTDDTCVAGSCVLLTNDANCVDDGLFCNGAEVCDAVSGCGPSGDPCLPLVCDEVSDSCSGCTTSSECDDGNICTDNACVAGLCEFTDNTAPCDDGLFCNGVDTCSGGSCISTGDPCTSPLVCDETLDSCVDCIADVDCDDGDVCTDDLCNLGTCEYTNNAASCDDGLFCTAVDMCGGGVCTGSGDPCSGQVCDEASGSCLAPTASLLAGNLNMGNNSIASVAVSGDIVGFDTFGVSLLVEIFPRVGNTGTVAFTPAPPTDVIQIDDPWPGFGTFDPFDTDITGSSTLNGTTDDNGSFTPGPVTFSGILTEFPVVASSDAGGVWDVLLSTSVGDSSWEGLATTLVAGTITVDPPVGLTVKSFAMPPGAITDVIVSGGVSNQSTFGATVQIELIPRIGVTGTLTFTSSPPVDIFQIDDAWPGAGSFTPFDTDFTGSVMLNGAVDDNGSFIPAPLNFTGDLMGFPVIASAGASGVWDVTLTTSQGGSTWEGLSTVLIDGSITVTAGACVFDLDCDDANTCTNDFCVAGVCEYSTVVGSCDDGDLCTIGDTCSGQVCVGSSVDCTGLDDSCALGACNPANGVCEAVPINESGLCDDADLCTSGDTCVAGTCTGASTDCTGLDDVCNLGTCNPASGLCEAVASNEGGICDDLDLCTSGDACTSGVCAGTPADCTALDGACTLGTCNAATGLCEAGAINEGLFCDDGDLCTNDDICASGVCLVTVVNCSGLDDECNSNSCNPANGLCEAQSINENGVCSDGDPCTTDGTCQSGVCDGIVPISGCQNCRLDIACNDLNECTANLCIGGVCQYPNTTGPCDDGDPCTVNDACSGGACAASPKDCSMLDTACQLGVCIPANGLCQAQSANDGGACDDGLTCTSGDVCSAGTCSGTLTTAPGVSMGWQTPSLTVQKGDIVLVSLVASSDTCADQSTLAIDAILQWDPQLFFLNGHLNNGPFTWISSSFPDDSGLDGLNAPFSGIPGNDGDALFQAIASFATGVDIPPTGGVVTTFEFTALLGTHGTSIELLPTAGFFTQTQVLGGGAFQGMNITGTLGTTTLTIQDCAIDADCNDANLCTDDVCNAGVCENTNNTLPCDDGTYCTAVDVCTAGVCVGSGDTCPTAPFDLCDEGGDRCIQCRLASRCDDGNVCTTDVCNNTTGACEFPNNTVPCNDGLFCTASDVCSGGACVGSGDTCPGAPNDVCDETADSCVDCLADVDCDDGNVCTDDSCVGNVCQNLSNTLLCDDGLFCTTGDVCGGGICAGGPDPCAGGPQPLCNEATNSCVVCLTNSDCDDGNLCTTDSCIFGVCSNANNVLPCDDGIFCTATDACSGGVCVGSGDTCPTAPNDVCDESIDTCVECLTVADCTPDGINCTSDSCESGVCVFAPIDAVCDDAVFCNGPEFCHTTLGCQPGLAECDDPALCDELTNACGCQEPVVMDEGSRYISVTPRPGNTPVALQVIGVEADISCVAQYVQANGTLGSTPVTLPPAGPGGWNTVHVRGLEIRPSRTYLVQSQCDTGQGIGISTASSGTTWSWGDADNAGMGIDFTDVTFVVDAFRGIFGPATLYSTDLVGADPDACVPQLVVDFDDIAAVVGAFKGLPYPCADICP